MKVICPYCRQPAVLVKGDHIYPHRMDLYQLNFWNCDPCFAYVGCHKKGAKVDGVKSDGTIPLGRLADPYLRRAKSQAHAAFDPIWKNNHLTRSEAYKRLAIQLGIPKKECHIGMFDIEMCMKVVEVCRVA